MIRLCVYMFFLVTIAFGCNVGEFPESTEIIKVDPLEASDYINISEIADSIKYVRLQVDSSDVMGKVREIVIREKYIYAMDVSMQIVFVFDKEGRFVSKLNKRGSGPDEYTWMGPVFISENEDFVDVIDYKGATSSELKRYSNIEFELIDSFSFPDVNCNSCKRNGSFYYFATQQLGNYINDKETNASLIILNDSMRLKPLFDKKIELNNTSFCPNIESFTKNEEDELFVSMMYSNTFFKLKEDSVVPMYTIDFGKYEMNNSIGKKSMNKQMDYILNESNRAFFPVLNADNKSIMSFSYYFKKEKGRFFGEKDFRQYVKIKKTGVSYHTKSIKNDLTTFPEQMYVSTYFFDCAHEICYKDYLVDIVLPNYYFRNHTVPSIFVEGLGEVTAEDDPIIILAKLKY